MENLKSFMEELNHKNCRRSYFAILLKNTNNVLAKLVENQTFSYIKKELMSLGVDKFIETSSVEDFDNFIKDLIYLQ